LESLDRTNVNVAIGSDVSVLVDQIETDPKTLCSSFSITFDNTIAYMGKPVEIYLRY